MEINRITRHGVRIDVLFTGDKYVFTSGWYGILAVAERGGYSTEEERNTFTISYGNRLTAGGSLSGEVCFNIAKAYIDKEERRYIADKELTFAAAGKDTSRCALDLQIIGY